jgi:hypothetical protein
MSRNKEPTDHENEQRAALTRFQQGMRTALARGNLVPFDDDSDFSLEKPDDHEQLHDSEDDAHGMDTKGMPPLDSRALPPVQQQQQPLDDVSDPQSKHMDNNISIAKFDGDGQTTTAWDYGDFSYGPEDEEAGTEAEAEEGPLGVSDTLSKYNDNDISIVKFREDGQTPPAWDYGGFSYVTEDEDAGTEVEQDVKL